MIGSFLMMRNNLFRFLFVIGIGFLLCCVIMIFSAITFSRVRFIGHPASDSTDLRARGLGNQENSDGDQWLGSWVVPNRFFGVLYRSSGVYSFNEQQRAESPTRGDVGQLPGWSRVYEKPPIVIRKPNAVQSHEAYTFAVELVSGWPMPAIRGEWRGMYSDYYLEPEVLSKHAFIMPSGRPIPIILGYEPLWPGFLVNVLVLGAPVYGFWWLGRWSIVAAKKSRRRRNGLCAECGYELGMLDTCPECGEAVRRGATVGP